MGLVSSAHRLHFCVLKHCLPWCACHSGPTIDISKDWLCFIARWFSNLSEHQDHLENLLEHSLLGLITSSKNMPLDSQVLPLKSYGTALELGNQNTLVGKDNYLYPWFTPRRSTGMFLRVWTFIINIITTVISLQKAINTYSGSSMTISKPKQCPWCLH